MSFIPQACPDHLNCETDSVTVCQGTSPWLVQGDAPIVRALDCAIDSVTICPPVSGGAPFQVEITGVVQVTESLINAANVTSVPASTSVSTILVPNALRKRAIFFNDSSSTAFLKFGVGASTTSYSIQIPTREFYELIFPYTGEITCIWSTADGFMNITEFE